jgi:hypothetical protein
MKPRFSLMFFPGYWPGHWETTEQTGLRHTEKHQYVLDGAVGVTRTSCEQAYENADLQNVTDSSLYRK